MGPEERLWGLSSVERVDVHQADVCALMSALLGTPFPVNSHGIVPLEYLDASGEKLYLSFGLYEQKNAELLTSVLKRFSSIDLDLDAVKAKIFHSNARQITAQFSSKMAQKRHHTFRAFFKEFKPLARSHAADMLSEGERLIFQGR